MKEQKDSRKCRTEATSVERSAKRMKGKCVNKNERNESGDNKHALGPGQRNDGSRLNALPHASPRRDIRSDAVSYCSSKMHTGRERRYCNTPTRAPLALLAPYAAQQQPRKNKITESREAPRVCTRTSSRRERDDKPLNALLGTDASCQPPCKSTVWGKTGVRCSKM